MAVQSLAFSPRSDQLVSAGKGKQVILWKVSTGKLQARLDHAYFSDEIPEVQYVRSGRDDILIAACRTLWSNGVGKKHVAFVKNPGGRNERLIRFPLASPRSPTAVAADDRVRFVAIGGADRLLRVIDVRELDRAAVRKSGVQAFNKELLPNAPALSAPIRCLAFQPGSTRVIAGCGDGSLVAFDIERRRSAGVERAEVQFAAQEAAAIACAFTPEGEQLVSVHSDGNIVVQDAASGAVLRTRVLPGARAVALDPDGDSLAFGCDDGDLVLLDLRFLDQDVRLAGHTGPILDLRFSRDGKTLATCGEDSQVLLWKRSR